MGDAKRGILGEPLSLTGTLSSPDPLKGVLSEPDGLKGTLVGPLFRDTQFVDDIAKDISDAIREKDKTTEPILLPDAADRIRALEVEDELYPIGFDVMNYVGRPNDTVDFHHGYLYRDGSVVIDDSDESRSGVFETYIPVNPAYRYAKSRDGRMYSLTLYDKDKNLIIQSTRNYNNLAYTELEEFPDGTAYLRFATHPLNNNWRIKVIRIS